MLILLPPSETKRDGGAGQPLSQLDASVLSFPGLKSPRRLARAELNKLARNLKTMASALGLSPHQHAELLRNRTLSTSPTMASMDRYTGVLYDGFGADSLPESARAFAATHVAIHSALFGLIGAGDPIPAYRLSHDTRLPTMSLKKLWRAPISDVLAAQTGLILDLRSESYAALGPAPARDDSVYLRVVADDGAGRKRALNHFNKKGKGEFARALALAGIDHPDVRSLLSWAASAGFDLTQGREGELELVVASTLATAGTNAT